MPSQYAKFPIPILDGGMVTSVSTRMLEQGAGYSSMFKNIDSTFPGLPRKRPACIPLIAVPSPGNGLHEFVKLSTGDNHLLLAHGAVVQRWDGTNWVNVVTGLSSDKPVYFLTIADQVAITNGEEPLYLWDGIDLKSNVGERKATMRTFLLYANNDLRYTAKSAGVAGNFIRVQYEKRATAGGSIAVSVSGSGTEEAPYLILVKVVWTEADGITSTANQVRTAIQSHSGANALVQVENVPDSDGTRAITEMPERPLTGGYDAVIGEFLVEYRLRAVMAKGSELFISHTGDPTLWSPGAVESNAVSAFVSPDDGEEISGLLSMGDGGVLIGKPSSLYGLFGYRRDNFVIDKLDPTVGVVSHRSMLFSRPYGYFLSKVGIHRMQPGGIPERISYPIQEFFDDVVDKSKLSEAVAFRRDRMYVISLPTLDEEGISLCYHMDREKWSVWDNPVNVIDTAIVAHDPEGEVYYTASGVNSIVRVTPGVYTDFPDTPAEKIVTSEITTVELDAGLPEVEKDVGDLYIVFRAEEEAYPVTIEVYLDGHDTPAVSVRATITGRRRRQKLVRVPVGRTLRFMEVSIKDSEAKEFTPMAMYYTYQAKEVL